MLLTGKVLEALTHNVPTESRENYRATKESLLNAMGFFIIDRVNALFPQGSKPSGTWLELGSKVQFQFERMLNGCESLSEAIAKLVMARLLSWSSSEGASFVRLRDPKYTTETVTHLQEFYRFHNKDHKKPWSKSHDRPKDDGHEWKGMPNDKPSWWVPTCFLVV